MLQKYVFGPLSLTQFRSEYMDRQPLLIKSANLLYQEIGMRSVDELLAANEGNIHSFTRVLQGNADVPIHSNPAFFSETQKAFVDRQFQLGATVKVEDFEFRHPLMSRICRAFEAEFGGDSYAMTFLTPAGQQGFGLHFDPVSSFITQLSGRKHWKVYPEYLSFPTKTMNVPLAGVAMPPAVIEATLEPGDLLYIPAGYPHEAFCTEEHSLHMTVGLGALRPAEVLSYALLRATEQHAELRKPMYPGSKDFGDRLRNALSTLQAALAQTEPTELWKTFAISYDANRHEARKYGLTAFADSKQITAQTVVSPVADKPSHLSIQGEALVIHPSSTIRHGRPLLTSPPSIELPAFAEEECRSLLERRVPIAVGDLPGKLDSDSKVVLVRRLVELGLVQVGA